MKGREAERAISSSDGLIFLEGVEGKSTSR